jgi:HD-like signal output (HDOD) protein
MSNASVPTYQSANKRSVMAADTGSPPEVRGTALEFLGKLATEVSRGVVDLPCFPDVVLRIRKALEDPKTSAEQRVTVVGAEPRLSARLLQTANSAAFNTSGKPLTDLRSAMTRLGQQLVQSAAMAYAVQQMKQADSLKPVSKSLTDLWKECITVASICQVVARRTKVSPDEAFLTGLLHGIGRLYIMVRAVAQPASFNNDPAFLEMVEGWHAQIGKAVLQNWQFAEHMCEAVGDQTNYDRRWKHETDLTDVLVASIVLGGTLKNPATREVPMEGVSAFASLGLTQSECNAILKHAELQLGSLLDALGC